MGLLNKSKLKMQDSIDFLFKCSRMGFPQSNFKLKALSKTKVFICINLVIFKTRDKQDQLK